MPTKIEWCDEVWNPVTGCTPISEGCQHCYAKRMARRLHGRCGYPDFPKEFSVTFHQDRLDLPMKWKKPRRIFIDSMGDFFHDGVDTHWIDDVLEVIGACPQHYFMILTKRSENIERKLYEVTEAHGCRELGGGDYLPNLWLGVTVENREYEKRVSDLLAIPAAVRFVSVEPMLGPVDLTYAAFNGADSLSAIAGVDWVIAGPETGPGARPCNPEWIEDLGRQCKSAWVPFFDKRDEFIRREWPDGKHIHASKV